MPKIFVVIKCGGEFEETWQHNLLVTPVRKTAEEYIAMKKAEDITVAAIVAQLHAFNEQWYKNNPHETGEPLESYPRWRSGLGIGEITEEMKRQRGEIVARNAIVMDRNKVRLEKWYKAHKVAQAEFLISIGQSPDSLEFLEGRYNEEKVAYDIEEVEYLP